MAFFARDDFICTCRKEECDMCNKKYFEPITNADRIRAMTDDELAKFLSAEIFTIPECNQLDVVTRCDEDCNKCWLDWLKQESEDKP